MRKTSLIVGAVLIVVAIMLGAFGAHGLKELVSPEKISTFEVGVRYQMYAGIVLLILGFNADKLQFSLKWISNFILIGVILFSGSIYALSMQELTNVSLNFLGPITPIGGLLMIIGVTLFCLQLIKKQN